MKTENFDRLVVVEVYTGFCGEEWGSLEFLPAGCCPDELVREMAQENANSFDNDDDEEDRDYGEVGGSCSLLSDDSSGRINGGFSAGDIIPHLLSAGRIEIIDGVARINLTGGLCDPDIVPELIDMLVHHYKGAIVITS